VAHRQRSLTRKDAPEGRRQTPPNPARPSDRELLYGRHAVLEMLRAGRRKLHHVYLSPHAQQGAILDEIAALARQRGHPAVEAPSALLDAVGPLNHQGVIAETGPYPYLELDRILPAGRAQSGEQPAPSALYLVLDHLQDVQNLGTLLRTAEAMAVTGVILPERRAAGITPAVVNSSAGAVEHLKIALVTNLAQTLERLKQSGIWIAGLDASPGAISLDEADLSGPLALVVGAEGAGLARLSREACDWLVRIPMYGRVASLNAAVAGSMALISARQNHPPSRQSHHLPTSAQVP
jgi:23S rRNA (guanosine2251-2'-O)-methyltransferase